MQSIKTNTILNFIKTAFSIIFPLITFPYVSRVLLPDNIGKVNWAITYVGYFSLIASLGISTYATRACSQNKTNVDELSKISSQLFSINVTTTIISYILLLFSLIFIRKLDNYRILIVIYSTTIIFTTYGMEYLNQAMEDFRYITIRTILFQILSLIALFIFIRKKEDYVKYIIITVFSSSGANLCNYFYRKKYCKVKFTLQLNIKEHIVPILGFFSMSLSQIIFGSTDITMLGIMWNDYEVGIYSTALKCMNVIAQLVQSLIYVILPRLSLYFVEKDYDKINLLLKKILTFNIGLGLPCFVGIEMLSKDITFLVGGNAFIGATSVLRILMVAFLFSLVGGSFLGNAILIPSGKEKYYMIVCWVTAFCNVLVNYLLIPHFGAVGAALATAFNGILIFVLLLFKIEKKIKIDHLPNVFVGPVIGCFWIILCCFLCYFIKPFFLRVMLSILLSSIGYFIILLITKNEFGIEIKSYIDAKFHIKNNN